MEREGGRGREGRGAQYHPKVTWQAAQAKRKFSITNLFLLGMTNHSQSRVTFIYCWTLLFVSLLGNSSDRNDQIFSGSSIPYKKFFNI